MKKTSTWAQIQDLMIKDTRSRGCGNTLTNEEIKTLVDTVELFGGKTGQAWFDLFIARYRIYDWLAMGVVSERLGSESAAKVLVHSFLKLKGDVDKFIEDLRTTDYRIITEWKSVELDYQREERKNMKFTPKINKAIIVASKAHWEQDRKADGSRFIAHPVAVAFIVSEFTDDEDVICGALLHDVLEDVPKEIYSKKQMLEDFGPNVVEIVEGVSEEKDASMDNEEERRTWKKRKLAYLKNLETDSEGSLMVCAADKIHNMQSTIDAYEVQGEKVWQAFNSSKEEKLWFHEEVVKIIERRLENPIVERLKEVLGEFEVVVGRV